MTTDPYADLVIPDEPPEAHGAMSHEAQVAAAALRLRVQEEARLLYSRQRLALGGIPPFDNGFLGDVLDRPAPPPHRVEGLIPSSAGTLLVAQRKTGKTTTILNLAADLIAGRDFLDRFPVRRIDGIVTLLNFEVAGEQVARWAADLDIPRDRLYLVNLRGRRNPFSHPEDLEQLAATLTAIGTETLIVDPFGRAYSGQSQNDAGEVGAWLGELDRFARGAVGAQDLILCAHAGWSGERARGASALEDWADSIITLTRRDTNEPTRYLRAIGRDVDVDEDQLAYDHDTRRLSLTGVGSRRAVAEHDKLEALITPIVDLVTREPGINGASLAKALKAEGHGLQANDASRAARLASERGLIHITNLGPGKPRRHYPATPPPTPSEPPPPELL